jgi:hypothetical protein
VRTQHRRLSTVVSVTVVPPFQPICHERNVCHQVVNCLTLQSLSTVNRKYFLWIFFALSLFAHKRKRTTTLFFRSILKHGLHFDYWNQPLNMRIRVCYLDCHEFGLCCYLVIHIENLLRPLQLFYFHLWRVYWLSLVYIAVEHSCGGTKVISYKHFKWSQRLIAFLLLWWMAISLWKEVLSAFRFYCVTELTCFKAIYF